MKRIARVVSIATAMLLGVGPMCHFSMAEAKPLGPVQVADAGQDMNSMNMGGMGMQGPATAAAPVVHRGSGTVKKIDAASGAVTLMHGPIPSLNWPAMTMTFKLKNAALAKGIKAGDAVNFELIQSGTDYVVTRLQPAGK